MLPPAGRNDPCPCGSGQKYKKCHGAHNIPRPVSAVDRANALKATDRELHEQLRRFANRKYGVRWLGEALSDMDLLSAEPSDSDMMLLVPWIQCLLASPIGLTTAEQWAKSARSALTPATRELLDGYRDTWISLWKIVDVKPGVGVTVTDALTGQERFVHEISGSRMMRRFDTLLAMIVTSGDVSFFAGLHGMPLGPREAEQIIREARRMCHVRTRPVPLEMLRNNEVQGNLIAMWRRMGMSLMLRPAPKMTNTDGDELAIIKDDFALRDSRAAIVERLVRIPGVEAEERDGDDTVFVVTRPGNKVHKSWDNTIIGRLVVSDTRLVAETTSIRRADALKKELLEQLGGAVQFRLRSEDNVGKMLAALQATPSSASHFQDEAPSADAVEMIREFRQQHMRGWLDESIPALGGMTPRVAATSRSGRPKLQALLEEFEQHENAMPAAERIDLGFIWDELGLKR